jgi:glutamate-1-semialdehyde aminotransferase
VHCSAAPKLFLKALQAAVQKHDSAAIIIDEVRTQTTAIATSLSIINKSRK